MITIIINFLKQNGLKVIQAGAKGVISFWEIFIRPFFFSGKKRTVIVPYIYIGISMVLFFWTVIEFLRLSKIAAMQGIKDAAIVLPTLAGVIATLIAIIAIMGKTYNDGIANTPPDNTTDTDKPNGVQ
jgi:hypothetical protein